MRHIRSIALATALAASPLAHAQTMGFVNGGTVTGVDVRVNGYFLVTLSSPMASQPACATNHVRVTGDATTPGGKALLSAAMLALSAHTTMALVQGTGTCDQYSGYEALLILSQGTE